MIQYYKKYTPSFIFKNITKSTPGQKFIGWDTENTSQDGHHSSIESMKKDQQINSQKLLRENY